jgi:hypothetical protein
LKNPKNPSKNTKKQQKTPKIHQKKTKKSQKNPKNPRKKIKNALEQWDDRDDALERQRDILECQSPGPGIAKAPHNAPVDIVAEQRNLALVPVFNSGNSRK